MKDFKPIEQYEIIRILLATRTKGVKICTHESVNDYITELLKKLPVQFVQCFNLENLSCINGSFIDGLG